MKILHHLSSRTIYPLRPKNLFKALKVISFTLITLCISVLPSIVQVESASITLGIPQGNATLCSFSIVLIDTLNISDIEVQLGSARNSDDLYSGQFVFDQ